MGGWRDATTSPHDDHAENPTAREEAAHPTTSRRNGVLTEQELQAIDAAVLALPPLTDEQIDALCEVIANAHAKWRAADTRTRPASNR